MDNPTIQRVRSHGAQIDRFAFDIADRFLDALFAACPHLRAPSGGFAGSAQVQRRRVAHRWAWFVRHLGELDRVTPELEALDRYLSLHGFRQQDFSCARTALLEALRDQCGSTFTPTLEADWGTAFDACAQRFGAAARIRMTENPGYALAA